MLEIAKVIFQLEVHQYANGKLQKLAVGRWRQKLGSSGVHQGAPRVGRPPPPDGSGQRPAGGGS